MARSLDQYLRRPREGQEALLTRRDGAAADQLRGTALERLESDSAPAQMARVQ